MEALAPRGIPWISRLRHDGRIDDDPPTRRKRGRGAPRKYGAVLDFLAGYGEIAPLDLKSLQAIGKPARGKFNIVLVRAGRHFRTKAFLFWTDLAMPAERIVQLFSARGSIEIAIRNARGVFT